MNLIRGVRKMLLAAIGGLLVFAVVFYILKNEDRYSEKAKENLELYTKLNTQEKKIIELQNTLSALQTSMIKNKDEVEKKIEDVNTWHNNRNNDFKKTLTALDHEYKEGKAAHTKLNDMVHQLHLQSIKSIGDLKTSLERNFGDFTKTCEDIKESHKQLLKRQDILYKKLKRRAVLAAGTADAEPGVEGQVKKAKELFVKLE